MPRSGERLARCKWGHDLTAPGARDLRGVCKLCRRERDRELKARFRAKRRTSPTELRQCPKCGETKPLSEFGDDGYCKQCRAEYFAIWRQVNLEKANSKDIARNQAVRLRCIEGYGGACVCCGETEEVFLQFDHVDGGGREHRTAVRPGYGFYAWIIRNNFPPDLQLLCANCHFAKTKGVACPHERKEAMPDGMEQLTLFAA